MTTVATRTCPLCEATCGLELHLDGRDVTLVRGDRDDVFSHGFLCPKGSAIGRVDADPDRVRNPLVRDGDQWRAVSWTEAFRRVDAGLAPVLAEHGRDAVGLYLGNPNVHNLAGLVYNRALIQALGSSNVYSASTLDQMPKQVAAGLMFGTALSVPVPDVDRTDHLLLLGANPLASNGSLLTAPDLPGRLRALRARGGKLVVVDPRRTKTAAEADEHLFIQPGTDALFLAAIACTLVEEDRVDLGRVAPYVRGVDTIRALLRPFTPEVVASSCRIDAATIRAVARELAAAPRAAVYARLGTCAQEFGTLASWLVDVCNILTGNLDQPGGAMFPRPAAGSANTGGTPGVGRGVRFGRRESRVRHLPEFYGELPMVCLPEEIDTPGEGQIRALITVAGNPVVSCPDSDRLDRALGGLDFMVSVDIYVNETTRHADVILPPPPLVARGHYDLALYSFAVRNVANYSPPLVPLEDHERHEWEILVQLAAIVAGSGPDADPHVLDDTIVAGMVEKAVGRAKSPVAGRDPAELLAALADRRGPERILDVMLRTGPYGDGFGAAPDGLSLEVLERHPHGVDLGPLEPRIPEVLRTESGAIELAPPALAADLDRLRNALAPRPENSLVLIGRRDLRSNNSWMHNVEVLVKGRERCTLLVHADDARRLGLDDGGRVKVAGPGGSLLAPVEVSDEVMRGVVSLPHGWGHAGPGVHLRVAADHAGVNSNVLADTNRFDPLSGTAVLNGIPVELTPA